MKKFIAMLIIALMALTALVPCLASAEEGIMYVNCADGRKLNLRDAPNGNCLMPRLDNGTQLELIPSNQNTGKWVYVRAVKTNRYGFVDKSFLQEKKPGKYEITERSDNFVTLKNPYVAEALEIKGRPGQSVGLRANPNKTAQAIRRLNAGDEVEVLARGTVWSKVRDLTTGRIGYMANDYLARL